MIKSLVKMLLKRGEHRHHARGYGYAFGKPWKRKKPSYWGGGHGRRPSLGERLVGGFLRRLMR
jgi:hypothetical protein